MKSKKTLKEYDIVVDSVSTSNKKNTISSTVNKFNTVMFAVAIGGTMMLSVVTH